MNYNNEMAVFAMLMIKVIYQVRQGDKKIIPLFVILLQQQHTVGHIAPADQLVRCHVYLTFIVVRKIQCFQLVCHFIVLYCVRLCLSKEKRVCYTLAMSSTEELLCKIKTLEAELAVLKSKHGDQPARDKISEMSSEVVDSNPYR